jgi:hypothetical protein
MGKIIKLTEEDLRKVVLRVIEEQTSPFYYPVPNPKTKVVDLNSEYVLSLGGPIQKPKGAIDAKSVFPNIPSNGNYPPKITSQQAMKAYSAERARAQVFTPQVEKEKMFNNIAKTLFNARNKAWAPTWKKEVANNFADMVLYAISVVNWAKSNPNFDDKVFKAIVGLLMRESKATPISFLHPKEIYGFVNNLFGGNSSQGYAQIKPETAKQYGVENEDLFTYVGSLNATYKIFSQIYNKAKRLYDGSTVTIYDKGVLTKTKALDNDAALHMAFAAYNAGESILTNWCQTNVPNIANPCNEPTREYSDGKIAKTDKTKPIPNYFPNKGDVHLYMPEIELLYNNLSPLPEQVRKISYLM